ncbi:MAG: DNA primase [Candidatus Omnitrophica bacterium]|nr:DNA primase [Candidatus Omnitrophota bacterium]
MPLIPEGILDEVQARTDIADLIGRYVPLKRAGRHFKAHCPFHKERTPSFMVNTEKQIFHCFGCGVGGNIFGFLMQHDRLTFPEAVRQLADHAGVRIPDEAEASSRTAHASMSTLLEKVCQHFERRLLDPAGGKAAREYLSRRGVSARARQAFRLGLAPSGWQGLLEAAKATGVSTEELEAAGLVIKGRSGYYDRFRHRLMFPIVDLRGRVVGFGGRSLDAQEPKYLNSPETPLYTKGRHLFGMSQAKDAVIHAKAAVVVEGYFDCVALADGGVAHVVSPLGTALTVEQARLLKRYAEQAILAFDADAAGEQGTLRGIDLLVEAGLQVRVAQLPQGMDPDEYLGAYGRQGLEQLLDRSKGIFDVLLETALRRHPGGDTESRVQAAQFVLPTIARVPSAMRRSEYVRLLAERLRLDAGAVAEELAKAQPRGSAAPRAAQGGSPRADQAARPATRGPEALLTALVLDDAARWTRGSEPVSLGDITDPALRRILAVVCELAAAGLSASPAQVASRLSEEGQGAAVAELVELAGATPSKDEAFEDCARRIRAAARTRELAAMREQIQTAQEAGHEAEVQRLLAAYQHELAPQR